MAAGAIAGSQDHYSRGLELADSGELEEAIQELEQAIQYDDKDARVFFTLGLLYERNQTDTQALETLLRAQRMDPRMESIAFALALLYEKMNFPDKAIPLWHQFIGLSKNHDLIQIARKHILFLERGRP
jgi:tetratricopeptide (TPR) repeat protein